MTYPLAWLIGGAFMLMFLLASLWPFASEDIRHWDWFQWFTAVTIWFVAVAYGIVLILTLTGRIK